MIVTKEIKKVVTQYNLRLFKNLGFKIGDMAIVPIEKWNTNSHEKIMVKCDICGIEKKLSYREYINSFKKYNIYACSSKCSQFKNKETRKEKYGDPNYYNTEKYKITCLEKYGVDNIFKNDEFKIYSDKIKREKYGDKFEIIVNKMKESMIDRYGVDNISKLAEIKNKKINTSLKNFGVDHPARSETLKKRVREKMIKEGKWINENVSEYILYTNLVKSETRRNINFINWNGYDYYDNEYISEYFYLDYNNPKYPTIDHKKSIRFGFDNQIDYKIIGSIDNLCYTKRSINSQKGRKIEEDFIRKFSHKYL